MPVQRSTSQSKQAIREHYAPYPGMPEFERKDRELMVKLIDRLEADFPSTNVWLLTSHYNLVLMDEATFGGRWLVMIHYVTASLEQIEISYLMPDDQAPFPNARVTFTVNGFEKAIQSIRLAMRLSGGWRGSSELGEVP